MESNKLTSVNYLNNPLRCYLSALLICLLLSLLFGPSIDKWQAQRLAELLPAIGILVWSFTQKSEASCRKPIMTGWYGLGLLGFAVVAVWSSFFGDIFLISMSYIGLVLLQFGLLPLLQEAWRSYGDDAFRLLAVFALAILGIDVGFLLISHFWNLKPYALTRFTVPSGERWLIYWENLYLFMNPRWANQITVLLIWSYIPVLNQLELGLISASRWFWWLTCAAVPFLGLIQIVVTKGDGAFISVICGVTSLALIAELGNRSTRRIYSVSVVWILACMFAILLLSLITVNADFLTQFFTRNLAEFRPDRPNYRILLWLKYGREALAMFPLGGGIPDVPIGSPSCSPHNLWLGLAYWSGLLSIPFAMMLASGFVPRSLTSRTNPMSLPLLTGLCVYSLVDDIWHQPIALAVILIVLPSLDCNTSQNSSDQNGLLGFFKLSASDYRLLSAIGLALIAISTIVPGGSGLGPSLKVGVPGMGRCLLML